MDITQALFRDLQERLSVGQAAAEAATAIAAQDAEKRAKKEARAAEKAAWHTPCRFVDLRVPNKEIRGKNGSFLRYKRHRVSGKVKQINSKNWTREANDLFLERFLFHQDDELAAERGRTLFTWSKHPEMELWEDEDRWCWNGPGEEANPVCYYDEDESEYVTAPGCEELIA